MAKLKKTVRRRVWTMADVEAGIVTQDGKVLKPDDPRATQPAAPEAIDKEKAMEPGSVPPVKEEKTQPVDKPVDSVDNSSPEQPEDKKDPEATEPAAS